MGKKKHIFTKLNCEDKFLLCRKFVAPDEYKTLDEVKPVSFFKLVSTAKTNDFQKIKRPYSSIDMQTNWTSASYLSVCWVP